MAEKDVDSVWSLPVGIRISWTNSMEELLAYTSSHMFIHFLLALNFVFSKTRTFKLLFILFVIKQLLIFTEPNKVLSDKGKQNGDSSDRNIAYFKRTIFHVDLFLRAKKIVFPEYLFLQMARFWKFRAYKLQPQRKKNLKKLVESRTMQLIFLTRWMERQAGHDGKTVVINWF